MSRITKADLEQLVEVIADEGYFIEYASGRPRLYLDVSGTVEEVSPRLPAREMSEWLDGFIKGLGEVTEGVDETSVPVGPSILEALSLAETTIERLDRHGSARGTLDVVRAAISEIEGDDDD